MIQFFMFDCETAFSVALSVGMRRRLRLSASVFLRRGGPAFASDTPPCDAHFPGVVRA
jgi:hypothetical protein